MLSLKRRVIGLERRTLAEATFPFDWSEIGEIPDEVFRGLTMDTLRLLAGAMEAEEQGRQLTLPEVNAATDLFRLRHGKSKRLRSGCREMRQLR